MDSKNAPQNIQIIATAHSGKLCAVMSPNPVVEIVVTTQYIERMYHRHLCNSFCVGDPCRNSCTTVIRNENFRSCSSVYACVLRIFHRNRWSAYSYQSMFPHGKAFRTDRRGQFCTQPMHKISKPGSEP